MTVSTEEFRRALARLAGGVAVVTSRGSAGEPRGMTATAVCSVSLSPPLVLACLDVGTHTHAAVRASGIYALHFLGERDLSLARRFAREEGDKFHGLKVGAGVTGAPVLEGALAWCDCTVVRTVSAGDHTVFIGRVEAAGVRDVEPTGEGPARPLVYYLGAYRGLVGNERADADASAPGLP